MRATNVPTYRVLKNHALRRRVCGAHLFDKYVEKFFSLVEL